MSENDMLQAEDDGFFVNDLAEANMTNLTSAASNNSSSSALGFDELSYLSEIMGPQRQPLEKLVPLTVVYTVMSITGIFGNLSVCCVILRIPSMRSATNYYLFSLAVSDLLILLLGKEGKNMHQHLNITIRNGSQPNPRSG